MIPNIRDKAGRAEVQKACDEATPGPWESYSAMCCPDMGGVNAPKNRVCPSQLGRVGHPMTIEDAEFCALARTALPDALQYIAELESRLSAGMAIVDAAIAWGDGRVDDNATHKALVDAVLAYKLRDDATRAR